MPKEVSIWVVGYDLDANWVESECNIWAIGPDGSRIHLGELPHLRDSGNRTEKCYVFKGVPTSLLLPEGRKKIPMIIANHIGKWTVAELYAVYVMPGATNISSNQAMQKIKEDIDNVREHALGFIEFRGSGVSIRDGATLALEIDVTR
jgi:hypothetical protein